MLFFLAGPDAFLVKLEPRGNLHPSEHHPKTCPFKLFVYPSVNMSRAGMNAPFFLKYREDYKQTTDGESKNH